MFEKNLGMQAVDRITGFKGVVMIVTAYLHGVDRASVQPPVNDKEEVPKGYTFDSTDLEIGDRHKSPSGQEVQAPVFPTMAVEHGQRVIDPISKFKGTVVAIGYHLSGCVRVGAIREVTENRDHTPESPEWFDMQQMEIINKTPVQKRDTSTGGPEKYTDNRRY